MDSDPSLQTLPASWDCDVLPGQTEWDAAGGWMRRWDRFEACVGLCATFFLGFAPVIPLSVVTLSLLNRQHYALAMVTAAGMLIAAGLATWIAAVASNALRNCFPEWADDPAARLRLKPDELEVDSYTYPFAVEMALSMPPFPVMLRPVMGMWWLLHFAAGLVVGIGAHDWIGNTFPGPVAAALFVVLAHTAFVLASNLYLVLAVAAVVPNDALLTRVWKSRFLVDVALSTTVFVYYLLGA